MSLEELKQKVSEIETDLNQNPYVLLHQFQRNNRLLNVALTERLRRQCKKGKVWKSKAFLTALKNAEYGFEEELARSTGGRDGIFLLDRNFKPANMMMKKIFDQYLDKADSGADKIASELETKLDSFKAVRLVSHHMRLLGLLWQAKDVDWLILIDYDQS